MALQVWRVVSRSSLTYEGGEQGGTIFIGTPGVRMRTGHAGVLFQAAPVAQPVLYILSVYTRQADRRVEGLHCGSLCPLRMQEGCKRYPCLLLPCPTLTLLHPGQAAKEWGSPGNRTAQGGRVRQHGGQAFSLLKRSGTKYKQNLFQYTVSLA